MNTSNYSTLPPWFSQPAIMLGVLSIAFWCGKLTTELRENVDGDKKEHSMLFQSWKETNRKLDDLINELRRNK